MSDYAYQGINFHYEVEGDGNPILFLHGLGGDWIQCKTILEHVHGFSKVLMDVRGHGGTYPLGPSEMLNFDQFAEDAMSLITHLGYDQFIVGGISMGSAIAIKLALIFPDCIKALILIRPAWLNRPVPVNLREHIWIGELLQKFPLEQAKCVFSESEEYNALRETAPAVAVSLLGQFDKPLAKDYAIRLSKIPASIPFDKDEELQKIQAETLILGTNRDPVHPLWMAENLATKIPMARFYEVTSKSEDVDKHFEEISYHIVKFLGKF